MTYIYEIFNFKKQHGDIHSFLTEEAFRDYLKRFQGYLVIANKLCWYIKNSVSIWAFKNKKNGEILYITIKERGT